jgi:hypothetical protein
MCEKCVAIDGKIEHYENLASLIADQQAVEGIKHLIAQMGAEKQALHPARTAAVCSDLNNSDRDRGLAT